MIAIIGGGPAGIALAAALDRHGLEYTLLEARNMGSTWRRVPPDLTVLSPWWTNILDASGLMEYPPLAKAPAGRYVAHLERVAKGLRGTIRTSTRAVGLRAATNDGWEITLRTATGEQLEALHAGAVVVCTGYFDRPALPRPTFENDGSIPACHAAEITHFELLDHFGDPKKPVLLVGKRVTAGQFLLRLATTGRQVELSSPSKVVFRRHGALAWSREMLYYAWESLQLGLRPGLKRDSFPPMEGGECRRLIESGAVRMRPALVAVRDGMAHFADGSASEFGAVVLATGYLPQLELLEGISLGGERDEYGLPKRHAPGYELAGNAGLYLLGFDNLRSHRSRYLRGIRSDAHELAALINARVHASR